MILKSVSSQEVNYKSKLKKRKRYTETLTCSPKTAQRVSFCSELGYTEGTAGGAGRPLGYIYPMITLSRMPFPSFDDMVKDTEVCVLVRLPVWWTHEHPFLMCLFDFSYSQFKAHTACVGTFDCRLLLHFQVSWVTEVKPKSPACFKTHWFAVVGL